MAAAKPEKSKRANTQAEIGIIGGSGLYSMNGLTKTREVTVKTPFGEPSDAIVLGMLEGKRVAFWHDMDADTEYCRVRSIFGRMYTR